MSASYIIGIEVTASVSATIWQRAVVSTSSMSGLPFKHDAVRLLDHMPSKPTTSPSSRWTLAFSAIMPVRPECVSRMRSGRLRVERSFFTRGRRSLGSPVLRPLNISLSEVVVEHDSSMFAMLLFATADFAARPCLQPG